MRAYFKTSNSQSLVQDHVCLANRMIAKLIYIVRISLYYSRRLHLVEHVLVLGILVSFSFSKLELLLQLFDLLLALLDDLVLLFQAVFIFSY